MKKLLLATAALSLTAGAWAKTYEEVFPKAEAINPEVFTDWTPKFYKFYKGETDLDALIRTDVESPGMPSLGTGNYIKSNTNAGKNLFTTEQSANGNFIFGGAYQKKQADLKKAYSLYDFGGEIGEVLILNGKNSNLDQAIADNFGVAKPQLAALEAGIAGNLQLFYLFDNVAMDYTTSGLEQPNPNGEDGPVVGNKVRVRMEFSIYNNDMTSAKQGFTFCELVGDEGSTYGKNEPVFINQFAKRVGDSDPEAASYDETATSEWNPYRWMVLDFDVDFRNPYTYIRHHVASNNCDFDNGAILIRSIEIYTLPGDYDDGLKCNSLGAFKAGDNRFTWNDYTPKAEPEAVPIYLMGSGAGLSWDAFPGMEVQPLEDGTYKFTIDNLSAFKMSVNKATEWDNDGGFNAGAFGYEGTFGDAVFTSAGQTVTLAPWGENQDMPYAGNYTITINKDRSSMNVKANFTKPTAAPDVYIRGGMNNWGSPANYKFTNTSWNGTSGTWTWTGQIAANTEFKIADANWGNINYSTNGVINKFNEPVSLVYNQQNMKFAEAFNGTITLNITNYTGHQATATFTPEGTFVPVAPSSMYVIGTLPNASWNPEVGAEMTETADGVFEIANVQLQYGADGATLAYFALASELGSWEIINANRFSPAEKDTPIVLGTEMTAVANVDASWSIEPGTYKMVFDWNKMTLVVTEASSEQPGDELSGTANMTYQVDMNMGWFDEPDLTEPITDEVEVAYVDGKLKFDTFGECDLPITFEVNVEDGTASAKDQIAYIDDWYESEEDYQYYYYASVANRTTEVTAELFNVEGEEFTTMTVENWGELHVGYNFFNAAFYNTVIVLPFKIEGLPEKAPEVVPSIEGEWSITLNGHYLGAFSLGEFTEKFIATQEGDVVTFESTASQYDMKATLEGNTLYFTQALVGNAEATYALYQVPYVNETGISDIDDLEAARVNAVTATVDIEAGTITFEENSGLLYGYFKTEDGAFSYWDDAFDFVSAVKGEAQVGDAEITINPVSTYADGSTIQVLFSFTTENLPADALLYAIFTETNSTNNKTLLVEASPAYFEFENMADGDYNYTVVLRAENENGDILATSNEETFSVVVSGIEGVEMEGATVRYFNLQGVEIAAPAPGTTVIKVVGKTATKVLVK